MWDTKENETKYQVSIIIKSYLKLRGTTNKRLAKLIRCNKIVAKDKVLRGLKRGWGFWILNTEY